MSSPGGVSAHAHVGEGQVGMTGKGGGFSCIDETERVGNQAT